MIPLGAYLLFTTALFCIGLYGVMTKRNAVRIIMGIELMLNAGILNFVVFTVYGPVISSAPVTNPSFNGAALAFFGITLAAAEAAVGLSILLILYRNWEKIDISEMDLLKG